MSIPREPAELPSSTRMWWTGGISLAAIGLVLIALLSPRDPSTDSKRRPTVPTKTARPGSGSHRSGNSRPTASESLGHQEFVLGYKSFESAGPACHPAAG